MENQVSFQGCAVVACGTVSMELNHLRETGFLDAERILFTKPGRHERIQELESQLIRQIAEAKKNASRIIVVYGGKFCYINVDDPFRTIDTIIQEQVEPGIAISRIKATHCIDMMADAKELEAVSQGNDVYWLTPGWMKFRQFVFEGWDKGLANENFPKHTGGAIMLDGVGYFDHMMENDPEKILEFSDWMAIPLDAHRVTLDRLKKLLADELKQFET